jgi:hypothetical protein
MKEFKSNLVFLKPYLFYSIDVRGRKTRVVTQICVIRSFYIFEYLFSLQQQQQQQQQQQTTTTCVRQ